MRFCPRCNRLFQPKNGPGRPRIWCSDACKVAASRERRIANRLDVPVRVVEVVRDNPETLEELEKVKKELQEARRELGRVTASQLYS